MYSISRIHAAQLDESVSGEEGAGGQLALGRAVFGGKWDAPSAGG